MVDRQGQRRRGTHRQTDDRITGLRNTLVRSKIRREFLSGEGFPLVGPHAVLALGRVVPVRVEAGLTTDGHDHGDTGLVVVLERRGLDVPTAEVIARTQTVQQVDGLGATGLELNLDLTAHRRRRHLQVLDRKPGT
ncbi:Uncharacterised protein [Mycobacteroides abscessus subsp. abscessus]|nr:Uncharacterised protein [Mycobacteroides abscessus subsp. abscessus]